MLPTSVRQERSTVVRGAAELSTAVVPRSALRRTLHEPYRCVGVLCGQAIRAALSSVLRVRSERRILDARTGALDHAIRLLCAAAQTRRRGGD